MLSSIISSFLLLLTATILTPLLRNAKPPMPAKCPLLANQAKANNPWNLQRKELSNHDANILLNKPNKPVMQAALHQILGVILLWMLVHHLRILVAMFLCQKAAIWIASYPPSFCRLNHITSLRFSVPFTPPKSHLTTSWKHLLRSSRFLVQHSRMFGRTSKSRLK